MRSVRNPLAVAFGCVLILSAVGCTEPAERAYSKADQLALKVSNRDVDIDLQDAIAEGDLERARKLVDQGADVDARTVSLTESGDKTTLMVVAGTGYTDGVRFLLEAGADPNLQEPDGSTALHRACKAGNTEIVGLLLEAGADPTLRSRAGETPRSIAEQQGHDDLLALFDARTAR